MKGKGIFARAGIFAGVQNPVSSTDATKFIPSFSHIPDFSGGSDGKGSACHAGDPGLIAGSGRSPGEGNGTPLQSSCLYNPMDSGAWWATVHGVAESDMSE